MGFRVYRGSILVTVLSVCVVLLGISPAHAAPKGTLKVTIVAPKGVAAKATMTKSSKKVTFSKPASGKSKAVSKKVATGTWKPSLVVVKSGSSFYVPTANKKSVKVKKGKTSKVKVTYKKARVASKVKISTVSPSTATVSFVKPNKKSQVRVRVLKGSKAPKTVSKGTAVKVSGSTATAKGLNPNTTYTFGVFTKVGSRWVGPVSAKKKTPAAVTTSADRQALIAIKNANPGNQIMKGWTGTNHCTWEGIECTGSRVRLLDLNKSNLSTLPSDLGNLARLDTLEVRDNKLTSLPKEIGNLSNLTLIYADENELTSLPDELTKLTKLNNLNVNYNELTDLPEGISALTNLGLLTAVDNKLTHVPEGIGALTNLTILFLDGNELATIPVGVGNLTNLTKLDLSFNRFSGDISAWTEPLRIANKMEYFRLSGNECLTVGSNTALATWLTGLETGWQDAC